MEDRPKRKALFAEIDRMRAVVQQLNESLTMFRRDGARIMKLHMPDTSDAPLVKCFECQHQWPCNTYRIESGIGDLSTPYQS